MKKEPFTAHGYYVLSNSMSLSIEISRDGEAARVGDPDKNYKHARWQLIKYNRNSEPYVKWGRLTLPLNQFMRVNL